jgi:hypothetical protein
LLASPSGRVGPGFVIVLVALIAVTTAVYGFLHVYRTHATSRAQADLAAAVAQLSDVRWPANFIDSVDDFCPRGTRCLKTASDPQQAVEHGLAALEAAGFQRDFAICEGDYGLGSGCHGHTRLGKAAVAVGAELEPPAESGSRVMVSEPFLP